MKGTKEELQLMKEHKAMMKQYYTNPDATISEEGFQMKPITPKSEVISQ